MIICSQQLQITLAPTWKFTIYNHKHTFVPSSRLPLSSVKLSYAAASSLSFCSLVTPDWLFTFACVKSVCAAYNIHITHGIETDVDVIVLSTYIYTALRYIEQMCTCEHTYSLSAGKNCTMWQCQLSIHDALHHTVITVALLV